MSLHFFKSGVGKAYEGKEEKERVGKEGGGERKASKQCLKKCTQTENHDSNSLPKCWLL